MTSFVFSGIVQQNDEFQATSATGDLSPAINIFVTNGTNPDTIAGDVFQDFNMDGVQKGNEPGIGNVVALLAVSSETAKAHRG
eukprot:TRINITY_DN4731_c1_g1_i1.p1 TRINITY_DN4731_c1_g1~~TRINITY_DN4731_c1_g1_i1.p1  ORF type:complete len:83 (+),score=16.16 TRINITY_DN4731_c1_g1_i1:286-534(+)